ncbi:hypothetical protein ZWY2020_034228 [Hordeum vulgare]|nr:hypothetical protein ZWY2020_034228 [Hordeum vulgare]
MALSPFPRHRRSREDRWLESSPSADGSPLSYCQALCRFPAPASPSSAMRPSSSLPAAPATSSRPSSPASVGSSVSTPLFGHPASIPATAICYLPRSQEVIAAERALERALLVIVASRRTGVSRDEIAEALRSQCGLADGDFSIHRHASEDFLIRFNDPSLRTCVATTRVRTPRICLIFRPWGRSAGSEPVKALFLVSLELFGIPDHAWHRSAAETLLSLFCKIEHLASETRDMCDMYVFKLAAWTINPDINPALLRASRARRRRGGSRRRPGSCGALRTRAHALPRPHSCRFLP